MSTIVTMIGILFMEGCLKINRESVRYGDGSEVRMDVQWIVLAFVGWGIGMTFVLVLMHMAGDEDRDARHLEKQLFPYSDVGVTITPWTP